MRGLYQSICMICLLLGFVLPAQSQKPTVYTENPQTEGKGKLSFDIGVEYLKKRKVVPPRAPISLWRIPVFRSYLGVGEIVDAIIDWRGRLFATQGTGRHVSDWGDLSVGTKIKFLKETNSRPALGVMYLVKLPNTSHDELLGSNATDFFFSLLAGKRFQNIQVRLNLGIGILDHPEEPHTQRDIYTMGLVLLCSFQEKSDMFLEWTGFLGSHRDQAKFILRYGLGATFFQTNWSVYGSFRVIGDEKDFGTAFEYSESWGLGISVKKEFSLW